MSESHTSIDINPVEEMNYEQASSALEQVVLALESQELSLDQAMNLFERGQALARRCTELLDQADLKVKVLTEEGFAGFDEQG
jgi:exodeoxyribonuclease VII small subunit